MSVGQVTSLDLLRLFSVESDVRHSLAIVKSRLVTVKGKAGAKIVSSHVSSGRLRLDRLWPFPSRSVSPVSFLCCKVYAYSLMPHRLFLMQRRHNRTS